jgi:hypothetical protein
MLKSKIALFAALYALLVSLTLAAPVDQSSTERIKAKQEWLSAAQKIFDETGDEEAKVVLSHVLRNMVATAPRGQKQVVFLEKSIADAPWTGFLPLLKSDVQKPYVKEFARGQFFAMYQPDNNLIIVREYSLCSKTWKGLMLLHEGYHSGDYHFQPYDWKDPQTFSDREREVHNFQNRLVSKLGGVPYQRLLEKEIIRIREWQKARQIGGMALNPSGNTKIQVPTRAEYHTELDRILSPALSSLEKDARETSFWLHAIFTMYDQDRGIGLAAENGKTVFLMTGYLKTGIIK